MVEAARLAGVPHILCEPSNLWWGSLPTGADGTASALVVPSYFAGRFWRERGASTVAAVVPPGFEAGPILRQETNVSRVRFGFVGRLAPQKSPGLFIRAAAAVGAAYQHTPLDVSFAVLGDGPLREPLERLAHRLGLRVTGGRYVSERGPGTEMHFAGWLEPSGREGGRARLVGCGGALERARGDLLHVQRRSDGRGESCGHVRRGRRLRVLTTGATRTALWSINRRWPG